MNKIAIIYSSVFLLLLTFAVENSLSSSRQHNHQSHQFRGYLSSTSNAKNKVPSRGVSNIARETILRRPHRQAGGEDSYEDVVEYEYEDEVSPTTDSSTEAKKEGKKDAEDEEKPTETTSPKADPNEEGEGEDEYYDTYDEGPNNNGGEGENEAGRVEEEEEEPKPKDTKPREDNHDDDADEDSAEREDRLEEERRQASIREQERLEEERREEERREQQRRQEAAEAEEEEEEEEEDHQQNNDDLRRREYEERIRAEAEAEEERKRAEEAKTNQVVYQPTVVPDHRSEPEGEEAEYEEVEESDNGHEELHTTQSTITTANPIEGTEDEYEVEEVEEPVRKPHQDFEEEQRHRERYDEQDVNNQISREEIEETDEGHKEDNQPTESEERRPSPIPIEESGRDDLERYTAVHERRPLYNVNEDHSENEGRNEEDGTESQEEETESSRSHHEEEEEEVKIGPQEVPEERNEHEYNPNERRYEISTTEIPKEEYEETEEEEEDKRLAISTTTTTEQPPYYRYTPTVPTYTYEVPEKEHSIENEINSSEDEERQENYGHIYSWTSTTVKPDQFENEADYNEANKIHKEIIPSTENPITSVDVERVNQQQGSQLPEEDDDEDDGFYEGRRFNEENRRNNVIEEEEDEFSHAIDHVETNKEIGPASNLDLSHEPEEDTEDVEADHHQNRHTTTTTTTTTTSRPAVHFPSVNEIERHRNYRPHHYPDENHINRIDDNKMTSFSENKLDESNNQHQHRDRNNQQHGSSNIEGSNSNSETFYNRYTPNIYHRRPHYNQYETSTSNYNRIEDVVENRHQTNHIDETPSKIECFSGYHLSDDGTECLDIDECLQQNACGPTQICLNTPGSYRCSCNEGFEKDFRNQLLCRDVNECEIDNGRCSQDCVNIAGSYYCSCGDDYQLAPDKRTCVLKPTTTTSTTTTTTTTPRPITTIATATINTSPTKPSSPIISVITEDGTRVSSCPTPPVPRGSGIAYLYCSRSPVGIHHRHSQLERRLLQDWAARKNRYNTSERVNSRFRLKRTLKRRRRQHRQTTYSPGSTCELRCRSGYELKGQYNLHCNATTGLWEGTTEGYCQAAGHKSDKNGPSSSEVPFNEIPRIGPNEHTDLEASLYDKHRRTTFKPSFRPSPIDTSYTGGTTSFRTNFYQLPTTTSRGTAAVTLPSAGNRFDQSHRYWTEGKFPVTPSTTTTTTTIIPHYNFYSPVTPFNVVIPSTSTTTLAPYTTTRNSFIHLTYRFKTPWIRCPDDIKIDLQPGQRLAYVIIPQPQTNVDWWRQVTSEPAWAKGLETEIGPGKQKITYRARTPAPLNNSAECSFVLEIRDIEPPTIRDCPESFTVRLSPGQSARAVTWVEPHFSDNVRVATIKKSREPGTIMTAGEHVINYETSDSSNNRAKCTFTVKVLRAPVTDSRFNQNNLYKKPDGTEGVTSSSTSTPIKPDVHSTMRNVVCYVGKKGRRIVFQSRVVPRGCSEMSTDLAGDSAAAAVNDGGSNYNTLNTLVQNSAENAATSQISSVSFSSNDHPQSASAFGQAISNGRNSNRLVHSTSVVTNGAEGTSSRASSYAISSSRNFDPPLFITTDKQVYDEDFVVPTSIVPKTKIANSWNDMQTNNNNKNHHYVSQKHEPMHFVRSGGGGTGGGNNQLLRSSHNSPDPEFRNRSNSNRQRDSTNSSQSAQDVEYRKYFRHFDSWDSRN